ncbi:MAG: hypothetical protein LBB60_01380 [Desulfovibrio sp.]|jgi:hypothetical protein|nr:hypothetical protein [Desulfovibrio sp.]
MGKPQRIPVDAIQAMKKILDALPDKNLDKTKEEALAMLNGQIQRAYSKGYTVKELAAILSEGKVAVSSPTLRAHTCPSSPKARKVKPEAAAQKTAAPPQTETAKPETPSAAPAQRAERKNMPSYYTPDLPDSEL